MLRKTTQPAARCAKVVLLVVTDTAGARAAMKATGSIPIVFTASINPVAFGLVASLARPGGNVTGMSLATGGEFAAKWLELLKQAAPTVSRVAVLWQGAADSANASAAMKALEAAAPVLKARLDHQFTLNPAELDAALAAIGNSAARALIVTAAPLFDNRRDSLVLFAASRRLPAIYFSVVFADAGGLMSYGPSPGEQFRRAASHVDRILKGAKPGDLPVEQPTTYDFVVNLKTARTLGLVMPKSMLLSANRVIE